MECCKLLFSWLSIDSIPYATFMWDYRTRGFESSEVTATCSGAPWSHFSCQAGMSHSTVSQDSLCESVTVVSSTSLAHPS